jgi:hypothetical protein
MIHIDVVVSLMALMLWILVPKEIIVNHIAIALKMLIYTAVVVSHLALINGNCLEHWVASESGCFTSCVSERWGRISNALEFSRFHCETCFHPSPMPVAEHPIAAMITDGYWH